MRPLESEFKKKFLALARQIPRSWFESVRGAGSIRGVPDIIGSVGGICIGLELKRDEAEARKTGGRIALQKHTLKKISATGGYTAIVSPQNQDDILLELTQLIHNRKPFGSSPRCQECGKPILNEWIAMSNEQENISVGDIWKCRGCSSGA